MRTAQKILGAVILASFLMICPALAEDNYDEEARQILATGILDHLQGCGPGVEDLRAAAPLYPQYPRRITDTVGTEIILYRPVERIVILHHQAADAINVIGEDDRIVGISESIKERTYQFPNLVDRPSVGGAWEPDIESILALQPDIVMTFVKYPEQEKLERHLPSHIKVVRMDFYRAEYFREEMVTLGRLVGAEANTHEYLNWHDAIMDLVSERVSTIPDSKRVRVYAETGSGTSFGRRAYSTDTGLHSILVAAGGQNVAEGHFTMNADVEHEWVISQSPDVILIWALGKGGYNFDDRDEIKNLRNEISALPGFSRIPAVRDDRIYVVTSAFSMGTASPAAVAMVAKWFYPALFEDIDPVAIHHEYLDRFTKTGEEIKEQGTFYYPDGRV
ncbi:ABC transporter substrate-binding protein [Methanoculleus chikugoensis]|uniref:Iron ABC transporter substrate-binding protein n=1 Tax=Methanoculleus chikugoensis TaxID=118126 RepID=A0ABN5XJY5_9EURY|nr:ABC transporter substrate-binding protein [Methanoculleus chikugoensis]BBL68917.1 iron ABC transporter substrate-binding protein [Methanoculleus chikugoensis]